MTGTGVYYGGNIVVPGTLNGAYRFQFNDQTFAYSLNVLSPPSVVSVTPANGAYNIGLSTNVAVTFDKPMDKPSTQAAFSLGAAGTFAWFDGDTRLVFTASLAPHTTYTVSISTGATGTNGQALVAAFSSTFDTGGGYSNMTVAGTFNGFNPAANNLMQLAGKNLWQYDTNFVNATGVQFKFAADGNWNVNWGDNNQSQFTVPMTGIGENFGSNIVVNSTLNGAYRFTLNDQTGAYALTVADTDGNGLPDSWEQLYFGHLGVNPSADADGDGLTNLQEYQAGTSPTDAGNALRILAVQRTGNNLAITFSTATGKQYFIEQRTNLTTGGWSALPGTVAGSGAPQSVTATNAIGCYRVRLAP